MSLETSIGSTKLRNPLILASGILGTTHSILFRLYEAGLGAVVTKSVGIKPRSGNKNPSIFALQDIKSVINSVGLANPGYLTLRDDLGILIKKKVPIIVSIFGENNQEYCDLIDGLKDLDITGFEINLSCPNTEKGGMVLGTDPSTVYNIMHDLKRKTDLPLWAKLTPNVNDIVEIADAAVRAKCDALVAINTLKAMVIDINTKTPILGFKKGGLSGAAIKPIGIRCVYDLYEQFKDRIPIIGVGGIFRGEDVIEYLLAGASAVEIGTAVGVAYPENIINFIQMRVKKYMKENNYSSIKEIIGGAHP